MPHDVASAGSGCGLPAPGRVETSTTFGVGPARKGRSCDRSRSVDRRTRAQGSRRALVRPSAKATRRDCVPNCGQAEIQRRPGGVPRRDDLLLRVLLALSAVTRARDRARLRARRPAGAPAPDRRLGPRPVSGHRSGARAAFTQGSGLALAVGIAVSLWTGTSVFLAAENAMNRIWGVPADELPGLVSSRLRALGLLAVLGAGLLTTAVRPGSARTAVASASPCAPGRSWARLPPTSSSSGSRSGC